MIVPAELVPPIRGATAFLSSQVRSGDWILPRLFRGVSVWGDLKIDLTLARFGAGISQIELVVVMGNVTILVPPDVRVDCEGDAVLGSFETQGGRWTTAGFDAPTIRVSGTAYMGSVEIKIVNPNAPSWLKTLRNRWSEARGLSAGQP